MNLYEAAEILGGIKPQEYRTIDTRTLKGLKQAERLQRQGWKQGSVGLFSIQFYRPKTK